MTNEYHRVLTPQRRVSDEYRSFNVSEKRDKIEIDTRSAIDAINEGDFGKFMDIDDQIRFNTNAISGVCSRMDDTDLSVRCHLEHKELKSSYKERIVEELNKIMR